MHNEINYSRNIVLIRGVDQPSLEPLEPLLREHQATLESIFFNQKEATASDADIESARYYYVKVDDSVSIEEKEALIKQLSQIKGVSEVYLEHPLVQCVWDVESLKSISTEGPLFSTPDFTSKQGYLNAAPGGVNAKFAWNVPNGDGKLVQIVSMEACNLQHENLQAGKKGDHTSYPHGTAVMGIFASDNNGIGTTGISFKAKGIAKSTMHGVARSIREAADNMLNSGDIITASLGWLIDGTGYPLEWDPATRDAIKYAVTQVKIIYVNSAGNDGKELRKPDNWDKVYSLLIGAGEPPGARAPRSRCDFSNFGPIIDAQGWGYNVATTGFGSLQGGTDVNRYYTGGFNGTSAAAPIVAGVLGCLSGAMSARGWGLNSEKARQLLRETGSPQQEREHYPVSQRIGNLPDLKALFQRVGLFAQSESQAVVEEDESSTLNLNRST